MSASSPSDPNATQRKWLPWVIGIIVVLLLAWWLMGRGKAPGMGAVTDSTQGMMAPATTPAPAPAPETEPAPAPAQTATPAPATTGGTPGDTAHVATTPRTPSRADTIRAPATPPPAEPAGPGAMGGRGAPGKKPPPTNP
jgi:hypothetical protein